jgi:hypothetical protein
MGMVQFAEWLITNNRHFRIKFYQELHSCLILLIRVGITYYDLLKLIITDLDLNFPDV